MTSRLPLALALAGLVSAGVLAWTVGADADPDTNRAAMDQAAHHDVLSPSDRAAFLDARIAALHAGLQLTPDQEKLWPAVETAFRDAHKTMADERAKFRDEQRPRDPIAWLQRQSERATTRGATLKKIADAAAPLYAALNDEQKHRFPILMRAIHRAAHFAMLDGRREGWREHEDHQHEDFDREDDGHGDSDGPDQR